MTEPENWSNESMSTLIGPVRSFERRDWLASGDSYAQYTKETLYSLQST